MKAFDTIPMEMRPKVRFWLPAAVMDEEDLRTEIRALAARGFGGIEAVVLQLIPPEILGSADGWGTENWNHMVSVMNETCRECGMSLDLAAGPGWPLASPALKEADAPGALWEMTYGFARVFGGETIEGALPEPRTVHEEGTPRLAAVMAYREDRSDPDRVALEGTMEKTAFGERAVRLPLIVDSYTDLSDFLVRDGKTRLSWQAPGKADDAWLVFAFYEQPAVQKINGGQTYVIDHLSKAGVEAMADYWEPVLSSGGYDAMSPFSVILWNMTSPWTGPPRWQRNSKAVAAMM